MAQSTPTYWSIRHQSSLKSYKSGNQYYWMKTVCENIIQQFPRKGFPDPPPLKMEQNSKVLYTAVIEVNYLQNSKVLYTAVIEVNYLDHQYSSSTLACGKRK